MIKKTLIVLAVAILGYLGKYVYDVNINYNFETITKGKVYKSGVIPPNEIANYIKDNNIKSVIDLRFPGTEDTINNPEVPEELLAEKEAIEKLENINYFNNGSPQIPTEKSLNYFYEIMDNPDNYPVLIHCHHGMGRAELYSALYRIEYEGWNNEAARKATRDFSMFTPFAKGKYKGDYLLNYQPRNSKK